jgi:hypothetical protein
MSLLLNLRFTAVSMSSSPEIHGLHNIPSLMETDGNCYVSDGAIGKEFQYLPVDMLRKLLCSHGTVRLCIFVPKDISRDVENIFIMAMQKCVRVTY